MIPPSQQIGRALRGTPRTWRGRLAVWLLRGTGFEVRRKAPAVIDWTPGMGKSGRK